MVRLIELTRSECFSATMILSSSSRAGERSDGAPPYCTTIGRAGQQSRVFSAGVPRAQNSRRCRAC
jgi:hypothetical protein